MHYRRHFKICRKCHRQLPLDHFHDSGDQKQGSCKSCQKEEFNESLYEYMYGVTKATVDHIRMHQSNRCAICDCELTNIKTCLDHNHKTMLIRGLLCSSCNSLIAFAKEDTKILEAAIKYLQSFEGKKPSLEQMLNSIGKKQI